MLVWMSYLVLVSALFAVASLAAERLLAGTGRATRFIWLFALLGPLLSLGAQRVAPSLHPSAWASSLWTVASAPLPSSTWGDAPERGEAVRSSDPFEADPEAAYAPGIQVTAWQVRASVLDPWLKIGWAATSTVLGLWLIGAGLKIRRERRAWTPTRIGDTPVLISGRRGPAVIGIFGRDIVLPAWIETNDQASRELMVRHEREHLEAADDRLLLFSFVVLILFPWNPALWWSGRRLRHAVEIDCDRRLVLNGANATAYSRLLVSSAGRLFEPAIPGLSFSVTRSSHLMRRIEALLGTGKRRSRFGSVVAAVAAVSLVALGCVAPSPSASNESIEREGLAGAAARAEGAVGSEDGVWDISPISISGWTAVDLIQRHYPAVLRDSGEEASVTLEVCVDETGRVTQVEALSPHESSELGEAAERVVRGWRYLPAWRYVPGSAEEVRPVAGCRGEAIWFFPDQLEKSRTRDSHRGLEFVLDGQLVRVWEDGLVIPIDRPRQRVTASEQSYRLPIESIRRVYRSDPGEIERRFGVNVTRPYYVLETSG